MLKTDHCFSELASKTVAVVVVQHSNPRCTNPCVTSRPRGKGCGICASFIPRRCPNCLRGDGRHSGHGGAARSAGCRRRGISSPGWCRRHRGPRRTPGPSQATRARGVSREDRVAQQHTGCGRRPSAINDSCTLSGRSRVVDMRAGDRGLYRPRRP
jgi:hypothetical protein